jgi:hypothetical protein
VVAETRHLDAAYRRQVDAQLAHAGINTMGFKAATTCARKYAYQVDPEGYLQRAAPNADTVESGYDQPSTPWRFLGNLIREMPGWQIKPTDCRHPGEPHKIIITTPTGHCYLSRAPDPP